MRRWDTGSGHRNSETGTETGIVWGEGDKLKQHQHLKDLDICSPSTSTSININNDSSRWESNLKILPQASLLL